MFPSPELVRHVDDIIRSNLTISRDWYLDRLQFSTIVVALGCAAEVPEVIHEIWPKSVSEKHVRKVKLLATVGLFVVIAGIAGEWFFEGGMTRYDGILQTINDALLSDSQLRTAIAEQSADLAGISAGEANERAGQANRAASEAMQKAENARLAQLEISKENLVLQAQVEQEKIERLKLEEKY